MTLERRLEYRRRITRAMVQAEPGTLFVFGDNMARRGFGGQAKEMRGEPNAVGIPTKLYPSMAEDAFFTDHDVAAWCVNARVAFERLRAHRGLIVWPSDGIGTGLAQLPARAPAIWAALEALRVELEQE